MSECITKKHKTETLFEYKRKFFAENGELLSPSFEFVTEDDGIHYLWKIESEFLSESDIEEDEEDGEEPIVKRTLFKILISLQGKLIDDDVAYIEILIDGHQTYHKIDSLTTLPIRDYLDDMDIKIYHDSFIRIKIRLLCNNDDSISQIIDNYHKLLENKTWYDVKLLVGDEEIPAHTQILSLRSPSFRIDV